MSDGTGESGTAETRVYLSSENLGECLVSYTPSTLSEVVTTMLRRRASHDTEMNWFRGPPVLDID